MSITALLAHVHWIGKYLVDTLYANHAIKIPGSNYHIIAVVGFFPVYSNKTQYFIDRESHIIMQFVGTTSNIIKYDIR